MAFSLQSNCQNINDKIMKNNSSLSSYLNIEPTQEQSKALDLCQDLIDDSSNDDFLVIRGSAGTGKSTIINAITCFLNDQEKKFSLSAPTGKAAKVIQKKSGYAAKTNHSLIYKPEALKDGSGVRMIRKINEQKLQCTFIIDEASMISDVMQSSDTFISNKPMLSDLLDFIKQGNPGNQVIFIGDNYQLPPINSTTSPALSTNYLINKGLKGKMVELTEVKRQDKDSYILKNATLLRNCIEKGIPFSGLDCNTLKNSTSAIVKYLELFERENFGKVSLIAYSNNDVNFFNNAIRQRLSLNSSPISIGDQVVLNKNWVGNGQFLLNGETGIIRDIDNNILNCGGISFVNAQIEFKDAIGEKIKITSLVMLDSLQSVNGDIGYEKEKALIAEAMKFNPVFRNSQMPYDDKFVGAMRLRYAYATTGHKAQGSEWENVILHPYLKPNDYRWQYTAITRASKELYTYAA
jgi:exodeoxyribonuclease-5